MSFLEVKNLNISYPTRKETIVASKNVEFSLERGDIVDRNGVIISRNVKTFHAAVDPKMIRDKKTNLKI